MLVSRFFARQFPLFRPIRRYASKPKSPMGQWYSNILPAMLPISLLATAVYTALLYTQLTLSHEKTMEEQAAASSSSRRRSTPSTAPASPRHEFQLRNAWSLGQN
ncbi:hypothetical protein B0H13DRAFT_203469 [Mycena leptocephala]|nr:hypothetical protein B0H13DRAFT_203469 [Mycena leptocephala]